MDKSSHVQGTPPNKNPKTQAKKSKILKKKTLNTINEEEGEDESDEFAEEHSHHASDVEESKESQDESSRQPEHQLGKFHRER